MKDIKQQRCFIVEGNIGAGKSTFLKMLKRYLNVQIVLEPHEKWQNIGDGHNLLEHFYCDPKRWAYTFQSYAFVSRVLSQQEHAKVNTHTVQILERSVFSDRYCFAKNAYELGYMNALEWKLYQEWFDWLLDANVVQPAGFIYMQVDPQVCYDRLRKRSRNEEATVSLDYIQRLADKHENWLIDKKDISKKLMNVPVLTLPCNIDFENNKAEQERHVEEVGAFVLSLDPAAFSQSPISPLLL